MPPVEVDGHVVRSRLKPEARGTFKDMPRPMLRVAEPLVQAARPTRLAILIPEHDQWANMAYHLLGVLSSIWGGIDSLIVPYDSVKGSIDATFLQLAKRYDPDVWCRYVHTYHALEMDEPASFETEFARLLGATDMNDSEFLSSAREQVRTLPFIEGEVPETVRADLLSSTWAVSEFDTEMSVGYIATNVTTFDAMVVEVAKLSELPAAVEVVTNAADRPLDRLQVASRFGALSSGFRSALEASGTSITNISVETPAAARRLGWGVAGTFDYRSRLSPADLSRTGLARFAKTDIRVRSRSVIVVGETFGDFAFARALAHEPWPVLWWPHSADVEPNAVADLMMATRQRRSGDHEVIAVSRSLSADALGDWRDLLLDMGWQGQIELAKCDDERVMSRDSSRLWDRQGEVHSASAMHIDETGLVVNGVAMTAPSVSTRDPIDMLWWVDIRRDSHKVPQRSVLADDICDGSWPSRPLVRIGRDGPTYFSQRRAFVPAGATLNHVLARPLIRFPDALTIFRRLAKQSGASIAESDKGAFVRHSIELWEDRDALASDLRDPSINSLLCAWLVASKSDGTLGYVLDRRRYLSIQDIRLVLGSVGEAAGEMASGAADVVVDRYLARGVLRRGLALKCQNCRNMSWYDADDFGQAFQCRRCRLQSPVDSRSRRGVGDDAVWYYSLSEVVFQALTHNSRVPLLACDQLGRDAQSTLWLPEQEVVFDDGTQCECDIWMTIDGRITLGEAKVNGSLGSTKQSRNAAAAKYRRLAEVFSADAVVFATSNGWDDESRRAIEDTFRGQTIVPQLVSIDSPAHYGTPVDPS